MEDKSLTRVVFENCSALYKKFHFPVCAADGEPLLNGANPVPDSYFTASSNGATYDPHLAGLPRTKYWAPMTAEKDAVPPTFYLQVGQNDDETV